MQVSFEDTAIIRKFEGYVDHTYLDQVGIPTCCWGITGPEIKKGMKFTLEQCTQMFMERINEFSSKLNQLIKVELTRNQYIACLSLAYNIGLAGFGKSTALKLINKNPSDPAIRDAFMLWQKAGGKVLSDLVSRRKQEADIYYS